MVYDLQKAGIWKRTAAWMFDAILTGILAVGFGLLLSWLLGYDGYAQELEAGYAKYEQEYGVVFDITQEEYMAMSEEEWKNYDAAYNALIADESVVYNYRMEVNLLLIMTSGGILLAVMLWEFLIPLWLGNGQTLGKKIFSLCLVRNDGVQLNTMQLLTRSLLGKYTVETMVPVFILLMIFGGIVGLSGTLCLLVLGAAQILCLILTQNNCAIHDLFAGTVVVDISSQMIFRTTEDLVAYKKKIAAEQAAKQSY